MSLLWPNMHIGPSPMAENICHEVNKLAVVRKIILIRRPSLVKSIELTKTSPTYNLKGLQRLSVLLGTHIRWFYAWFRRSGIHPRPYCMLFPLSTYLARGSDRFSLAGVQVVNHGIKFFHYSFYKSNKQIVVSNMLKKTLSNVNVPALIAHG
jgi:hypothetical protein